MTAGMDTISRPATGHPSTATRRTIALGALQATVAGLVAIEVYAVVLHAAGVPLRAGFLGAHTAHPVTYGNFAGGILLGAFWGTVLAITAARKARNPKRTFAIIAAAAVAASLVFPLGAGATAAETKAALACGHLLAAAVMLPLFLRHLKR